MALRLGKHEGFWKKCYMEKGRITMTAKSFGESRQVFHLKRVF
jgi:hypothetical protein